MANWSLLKLDGIFKCGLNTKQHNKKKHLEFGIKNIKKKLFPAVKFLHYTESGSSEEGMENIS